jgi:hypothetical protein
MDLTKFGFTTCKKKKTDDHDDEKKKQYETKRERNFQENWADEFPGVRHAVPLDTPNFGFFINMNQKTIK